jgi:HK97 family phage prohead protease
MENNKFNKSIEFKTVDDEKGKVEAVFSVFNNVDTDGDVVLPGSIKSGFKDNQVPMVFAHKWDQPIGKGVITSDDSKATFTGSFFMETEAGREAYNLAKEMGDLQEWSFGFRINDYESGKFKKDGIEDEIDVRYLKDLEVFEVSPVLVGANRETYTLAIKSGEEAIYESGEVKAAMDEDIFDNEEDAKKRAEELGCSGTHQHEVDGKEVYMPCSTHEAYEEMLERDSKSSDPEEQSSCCGGGCCGGSKDTEETVESKYGSCDYGETGKCAKEKEKGLEVSDDDSSMTGKRFSEEVKDVLAALDSLIVRAKAISVLRSKDGRTISENASSALRAVQEDLNDAWTEIDSILDEVSTVDEPTEEEAPVDEAPVEEIQEDLEIAEAEAEVEVIEVDVEEEEVDSESEAEEVEATPSLEEVDEEFEALFAEAQQNISESIVVELDDE